MVSRNEVWIIPTVGCVNGIIGQLAKRYAAETSCEGVDAIVAFPTNLWLFTAGR